MDAEIFQLRILAIRVAKLVLPIKVVDNPSVNE